MPSTSAFSSAPVARPGSWVAVPRGSEFELIRAEDVSSTTLSKWCHFQQTNPELSSGYFHPDFFHAVNAVRGGVELAVLHAGGSVQGLLPFQRVRSTIAHPAGGMMNDFHGLIAAPESEFDIAALLRDTGLRRFHFHAWTSPANPGTETATIFETRESPWINLSDGLQQYETWLRQHSTTLRRQPQKTRKLEREIGPVRLEMDVRDSEVLEKLIQWKREKFCRTRTFDLLSVDWTANLLREVFQTRGKEFRGMLSALWAGDQIVAAHFGFISGNSLHYWFPAYSHEHRIYSPGTLLLHQIIRHAGAENINRIDLGYGDSELKERFANRQDYVHAGCIGMNRFSREVDRRRYLLRQMVKQTPFKESLKRVFRPVFPSLGRRAFR
ncbi:MAG: GNAT family N-acetyltransferase [Pirellulaceae bacterium]